MAKDKTLKRVVGQSNELIRNIIYNDLDINDIKLFKTIISKINYNDTLFKEFYQIDYDELDMAGVKKTNRYAAVTASLKKLASTYANIETKDGTPLSTGLIKNRFMFPRNTSTVTVEIDEDLMPHLINLKSQYTKYGLEYISGFKNVVTLKLYELLRSFLEKGTYSTTVDNLRKSLEIEDVKYPLYGSFKNRILKPSLEQINESTDIDVKINENNPFGKKITSIDFHIVLKVEKEDKNTHDLNKLLDKTFLHNDVKYIVRKFTPGENDGYFNIEILNLVTLEPSQMNEEKTKEEIFSLFSSKGVVV